MATEGDNCNEVEQPGNSEVGGRAAVQDKLLVCAIDFGTTYSGYAFSFRHDFERDKLKISPNTSWTSRGKAMRSLKTPTTVLLKPDQSFHSFGYDAEDHYCELAENEEHHDWYYFRRFKMLLHNKLTLKRNTMIPDAMGRELLAMTIFTHAIRYISGHLLTTIKNRGIKFYDSDILWVLTVPAIWDEPAKQFMREAAHDAGLPNNQLKLALEPEAASLYCKSIPMERQHNEWNQAVRLGPFRPNTRYLVLDLGGGTVDVTVHEVRDDSTLREIHKASGGAWGGTKVDASYFELFSEIFGRELLEDFKKLHNYEHMDMERDFETKKRNVTRETTRVNFHVSAAFTQFIQDRLSRSPQDIVTEKNMSDMLTFKRDRVMFTGEVMFRMFEASIRSIVDHIHDVINSPRVQRIDKILMVGGFSECALVRNAVEAEFFNIQVAAPDDPGLAVLKGAVIFGHSPQEISSRVMRYTYGVAVQGPFDERIHPIDKRIKVSENEYLCKDLFSVFIRIDSDAGNTEVVKQKYTIQDQQAALLIEVFVSTKENPLLVTEAGCTKLGEIMLKVPLGGWRKSAIVTVEFGFEGPEFTVRAIEEKTQIEHEATFDFLNPFPSSQDICCLLYVRKSF